MKTIKNQNKSYVKHYISHDVYHMPNKKNKRSRYNKEYVEKEEYNNLANNISVIFFNSVSRLFNIVSIILFYRYFSLGHDMKNLQIGIICCIMASIIRMLNNQNESNQE